MKKVFGLLSAFVLGTTVSAVEIRGTASFSNEVIVEPLHGWNFEKSDDLARFGGVLNRTTAKYDSSLLKVGVDAFLSLRLSYEFDDDNKNLELSWNDLRTGFMTDKRRATDFYIEFTPIDMISIGFHDELFTEGAYMPVADVNLVAGNYSTDAISVLFRPPVPGLTVGIGFDNFAVWTDDKDIVDFGLAIGADFTTDIFSAGASIRHIGKDKGFQLGAFGSFKGIENLVVNAGFTFTDNDEGDAGLGAVDFSYKEIDGRIGYDGRVIFNGLVGIFGKAILSAGVSYDLSSLVGLKAEAAADFAFDFGFKDAYSIYDMYLGLGGNVEIMQNLAVGLKALALFDIDGEEIVKANGSKRGFDPTLGIYPSVTYTMGKNQFSAGLKLQKCFDDYGYGFIGIPLSWKYSY